MKQYIFGVDIGGTKTALVLADTQAHFFAKEQFETRAMGGPDGVMEAVFSAIIRMMDEQGITSADICAVGVSCGGPLDDRRGVILSPPNLPGWDEVPLVARFEERLGIPTFIRNDADACAIAEWKYGAGRGVDNLIFLTFGTGLGAGLILNGRPYSGACGMAGEAGHIRLSETGPVGYGKPGSFEGFCSGGGIAQLAHSMLGEPLSAKQVAHRALAGDTAALEVMHTSGRHLGAGLSILIDLFNPQRILIGGVYMRCEALLKPAAMEVIERETLPASRCACEILPAGLGEKIGDYAAVAVAAERMRKE